MDIKKFAAASTSTFQLRDGAEELMWADEASTVPIMVTVYGPGSKQYQAAATRRQNNLVDSVKAKGKQKKSSDERIAESADFLASITVSFENLDYDGLAGNALALAVYSDTTLGFIADQVAAHAGEWSNFTKGSATS